MKPWRWIALLLLFQPLLLRAEVAIFQERDNHFWAGFSVSQVTFDPDTDVIDTLDPLAANIRLGGRVYDYLGVEMRGGAGFLKDDEQISDGLGGTIDIEQKLVSQMSVMLVGLLPITEQWSGRGYMGAAISRFRTDVETCNGGCNRGRSVDDSSRMVWGAGLVWRPLREVGLTLEYLDYGSPGDFDIRALEVGALYFF